MNNDTDAVIVKLEGVEKVYKQGKIDVPALRGLDLEVHRGDGKRGVSHRNAPSSES